MICGFVRRLDFGEHGDGQSKAALLPKMFGNESVHAFGEFKAIWTTQQDEPVQGG